MAAPTSYPSYAYNATQLSTVIVANVTAFNALPAPGTWTTTPYAGVSGIPADTGFTNTDVRLQQLLAESRLSNAILLSGFNMSDDYLTWRQDFVSNDIGLTT